jgi:hypothetical protein
MHTMNSEQVAGRNEEMTHGMEGRYKYAGLLWVVAIIFFIVSEAGIFFAQLHRGGHHVLSLPFWYVPIMNTAPLLSAVEIYRRIVREATDSSARAALPKWSFNLAYLACVALATTFICYVDLLTGGF